MKHPYFRSAFVTLGSFLIVATAVGAWTSPEPGTVPPANNVPSPINVGNVFQEKTGGLWVNTLGVTGGGTFGGNVGIGTTDPKNKLHVYGVIGAHNPAGSPNNVSQMFVDGDTGVFNYGHMGGVASGRLDLRVENVPRLSILQSNGNVGIGTTNPDHKLHVYGGIGAHNPSATPNNVAQMFVVGDVGVFNYGHNGGVASGRLDLRVENEPRLSILQSNGNVGIGTVNPQSRLDVVGKIRSQSTANSDPGTTVVTKDYVDSKVSGGGTSSFTLTTAPAGLVAGHAHLQVTTAAGGSATCRSRAPARCSCGTSCTFPNTALNSYSISCDSGWTLVSTGRNVQHSAPVSGLYMVDGPWTCIKN